ncbi:MAG: hypothetical protein R3C24_02490 [Cyanobacteriota/Melainabacteria group bacterium]
MLVLSVLLFVGAPALARGKARHDGSRPNRVTVGTVEIKGWQHGIVKSYPNLKNYHWNPMYANVQGMNMVRPTKHSVKGKAKHHRNSSPIRKQSIKSPTNMSDTARSRLNRPHVTSAEVGL